MEKKLVLVLPEGKALWETGEALLSKVQEVGDPTKVVFSKVLMKHQLDKKYLKALQQNLLKLLSSITEFQNFKSDISFTTIICRGVFRKCKLKVLQLTHANSSLSLSLLSCVLDCCETLEGLGLNKSDKKDTFASYNIAKKVIKMDKLDFCFYTDCDIIVLKAISEVIEEKYYKKRRLLFVDLTNKAQRNSCYQDAFWTAIERRMTDHNSLCAQWPEDEEISSRKFNFYQSLTNINSQTAKRWRFEVLA